VYAIKYENGMLDVIAKTENPTEKNNLKGKVKVTTLLYTGASLPIGYFKAKNGGSALTGYTLGLEVNIARHSLLSFDYGANYTRHPFMFESTNLELVEGHYDVANAVVGLRLETLTSPVTFYMCALGGFNYTTLRAKKNIGSVEGLGLVLIPTLGITIKRFDVSIKYCAATPKFMDFNDARLAVKILQLNAGLKF